jgi:hypothetical protein
MHVLLRGTLTQRLRIASGLILFAFATTHFLNHAVGLVSLEMMHEAQAWRQVVTRSLPGTFVLVLTLITHTGLALFKCSVSSGWMRTRSPDGAAQHHLLCWPRLPLFPPKHAADRHMELIRAAPRCPCERHVRAPCGGETTWRVSLGTALQV